MALGWVGRLAITARSPWPWVRWALPRLGESRSTVRWIERRRANWAMRGSEPNSRIVRRRTVRFVMDLLLGEHSPQEGSRRPVVGDAAIAILPIEPPIALTHSCHDLWTAKYGPSGKNYSGKRVLTSRESRQ